MWLFAEIFSVNFVFIVAGVFAANAILGLLGDDPLFFDD